MSALGAAVVNRTETADGLGRLGCTEHALTEGNVPGCNRLGRHTFPSVNACSTRRVGASLVARANRPATIPPAAPGRRRVIAAASTPGCRSLAQGGATRQRRIQSLRVASLCAPNGKDGP